VNHIFQERHSSLRWLQEGLQTVDAHILERKNTDTIVSTRFVSRMIYNDSRQKNDKNYNNIATVMRDAMEDAKRHWKIADPFEAFKNSKTIGNNRLAYPLIHTHSDWVERASKSHHKKTLNDIAMESIFEAETIAKYRPNLLNSPAGHIRVGLGRVIGEYTHSKRKVDEQFQFWDQLNAAPTKRDKDTLRHAEARKLRGDLAEEIQSIINFIFKKKVAHLCTSRTHDEHGHVFIPKEIYDEVLRLVKVS
jgi:hypothetical protein